MKGIIGRKLGMTQVFDPETGVVTPVTVDRGRPLSGRPGEDGRVGRLRGRPARVRGCRRPEDHEARARPSAKERRPGCASPPRRVPRSVGARSGETVTVESFEPGDAIKVSGIGIGKGFAGTIKRHRFHRGPKTHGSHNIRKPGSIGASATPSRVFKGMKMAGRLGGKRVTQIGLHVHEVDTEQNLLLVKGAVPGPKNGIVEIREEKAHTRHHRSA
jgi:large subunit ribosomal protein L3